LVGNLYQNRGSDPVRVERNGGRRDAVAINPQPRRCCAPIWRPPRAASTARSRCSGRLRHNGKQQEERRHMDRNAIDRVVRKSAGVLGLNRGNSAHSMRATFITTALETGAQIEDVQKAAGHRDPSTTKLYDRRSYNPEKAASFFATY
jgi:integrase/recombinase XerD